MGEPGDLEGLVDLPRLRAWLDEALPELGTGPLEVERLSVHAAPTNEILELRRGGERLVLRRPPRPPRERSNEIMLREFRVLSALRGAEARIPTPRAVCDDPGVIGVNFYVMDLVDGFTPRDPLPPPFDADPRARRGLGTELVDALAELANVDYRAVGLADFGKPDRFLERQVDRWRGALESYRRSDGYSGRELPGLAEVADWLERSTPPMSAPGILHGDYQFINVMFHHGAPARLAAIVDWEQATIGDPLLDLGWMLHAWRDPGEPPPRGSYLSATEGLPTRAELAKRYAERTGRAVDAIDYYVVLAKFKLGCVMEGHVARARAAGNREHAALVGDYVLGLFEDARAIVERQ